MSFLNEATIFSVDGTFLKCEAAKGRIMVRRGQSDAVSPESFKIPLDQISLVRFEIEQSFSKWFKKRLYRIFFIEKPLDICNISVSEVTADYIMTLDLLCKEHGIKLVDIDNEPFLVPYDGYVAELD